MAPTFGTLRSLLQTSSTDPATLWSTLEALYDTDPTLYQDEIIPYLQGFPAHFTDIPLCIVRNIEDLERVVEIAPMGRFAFAPPSGLKSKEIIALFQSPALANLHTLNLGHSRVGVQAIRALKKTDTLKGLKVLELSGSLNTNSLPTLLDDPIFNQLESLELSYNNISGQPLDALATAFPKLNTLKLISADLVDNDIDALTNTLAHLKTLDITFNKQLSGATFATIATHCKALRVLKSYGAQPDIEGITRLGCAETLTSRLNQLMLVSTYLGPPFAAALFETRQWTSLEQLDIRNNRIGPQGAKVLAASSFDALSSLNIGGNNIGERGIKSIVESTWANQLTSLSMSATPLSDRACDIIAQSESLSNLRWLQFGFTSQSYQQWQMLLDSPYLHDDVKRLIAEYQGS